MSEPFLIVGLGNPGRDFRDTRHNVGFMLLDRLAVKFNASFTRLQSRALVSSTLYNESKVILAKPQTFMNLSGQAVKGLVHFYKIPIENLLVIHDDLDLPAGTIRIRPDGGSAGQKGMTSILEHLGTDEFARLRLGIGRPPGQMQAPDYVLQEFTGVEKIVIAETLSQATEAVLTWLVDGIQLTMTRFNGSGREA